MMMNDNMKMNTINKVSFWDKTKKFLQYVYEEYIKFPAFILAHPLKGFDYFKREKKARMSVAISFIIITIILRVLEFQYSGFVVNQQNPNELNTFQEIAFIIFPILLFVVSNWSVTTLFDGKGKMKEIFMMICYSLFPLIIAKIIGLIFSNIIVEEEVGFYLLIMGLGSFLMVYMLFFGLISIHEYGVLKCIGSILGTVLALLVLLFILLLGFDLFQQIYGFIYTIYREISLRYL